VTICTANRIPYFGRIEDKWVVLSEIGRVPDKYWQKIPKHHADVERVKYIIMPNHLHGILVIGSDVETLHATSLHGQGESSGLSDRMSQISPKAGSLGVMIRSYKPAVSRMVRFKFDPDFRWQKRYFDHIINNE
jgi:hypothetical protein